MNFTEADLERQYAKVKRNGWLPYFTDAPYDVAGEILLALCSRETNCTNELGDHGHGHGIGQIDDRGIYKSWCASGAWKDVKEAIRMACFVLRSKFNAIEQNKAILPADVLRCALASYNADLHEVVSAYLAHGDPDRPTTGHDYSRDVLARAVVFKRLLDNDH